MNALGDPKIDPDRFGPLGQKHIQAAGEASLNAANTHRDYQTVLRPQSLTEPDDSVTLSPDAQAALPGHPTPSPQSTDR